MAAHIEEAFEKYHKANPHVFKHFKHFANQAKTTGMKQFSANAIFERMRWYLNIETFGEPFKLSNNYRAYYARKLMVDCPEFEGFFKIKQLHA
mgnify:CR=1 FL=1|jgi:hypothetical protein|tara:strand:+ start:1260 stop:1538 length:279 start_codon:yes stop_codon:yes gene_type:complete